MKIKRTQLRNFAALRVDQAETAESPFISLSLSSETPVDRSFGKEILVHGPNSIDFSRARPNGLPLLVSHNAEQLPIGRIKDVKLDGQRLVGKAYFSARSEAQQIRQDILDGTLTDLSVGYKIIDYKVEKAAIKDNPATVYITRWMPMEGSCVSNGADATVGFGRSEETEMELDLERQLPISAESVSAEGEQVMVKMDEEETPEVAAEPTENPEGEPKAEEVVEVKIQVEEEEEEAEVPEEETKAMPVCSECGLPPAECTCEAPREEVMCADPATARSAEIDNSDLLLVSERDALRTIALNLNFRSAAEVDNIIATESLEQARTILLKPNTSATLSKGRNKMDLSQNELFTRGIANALKGNYSAIDASIKDSISQRGDHSFTADLFNTMGTRTDYTMTTAAYGDQTIYEQNIGFLDLLRARTAVLKAGGKTKNGIGSLSYMRQSVASVATLRGSENAGTTTETFLDFEKVPYTPKALTAKVYLTDELQKESVVDLQNIIKQDMIKQFALALDFYAIQGKASGPAIGGLLTSGSGIYDGNLAAAGVPTFASVNHLKALVDAKAVDLNTCAYILTPGLMGLLESTSKFSGGAGFAIAEGGKINGYNAFTSGNVPVTATGSPAVDYHTLVFGDFSNLEICLQGSTEFNIDISTRFDEGITVLTARQYFDIGLLQPTAFAACKNYKLS